MNPKDLSFLQEKANLIRRDIIRMVGKAGSGHPGGSLSVTDILTALYFRALRHHPKEPRSPDRDRVILSKGHAAPALYAALAEAGYFDKNLLWTLRELESPLQGHPDMRRIAALEASTGSLGQGLSIGIGCALAAKLEKKNYTTYVILSDGECDEGQVWEAAALAWHHRHRLGNLVAILDYNKYQLDDATKVIMDLEPLAKKWESFNWRVKEIDGHDLTQLSEGIDWAKEKQGAPSLLIAHTIKGKGVSFMENNNHFHGVAPTKEETLRALLELGEKPALVESDGTR